LSELMERHLSDSRRGKNIQLPLADLLRQSIYSRFRLASEQSADRSQPGLCASERVLEQRVSVNAGRGKKTTLLLPGSEIMSSIACWAIPTRTDAT
jgi:hypothetical protein